MQDNRTKEIAYSFLKNELLDYSTYSALLNGEKDKTFRSILEELAATEDKHASIWSSVAKARRSSVHVSRLRIFLMLLIRRLLGLTFTVKLLELNEENGANAYAYVLSSVKRNSDLKSKLERVLNDETHHERMLQNLLEANETELQYIKSIIFGLNDGLVEILAIVVGLAIVATSGTVVALAGTIAGISGTLSMSGGAYLSAKSEKLVNKGRSKASTTPAKEAYFTGIYYFVGALLSILPFAFGLSGYSGIAVSVVVVSLAIVIVSLLISVISGVNAKNRIAEMLAISLGAAFVTILFSTFAKAYWHISI